MIASVGVADAAQAKLWDQLVSRLWWDDEGGQVLRVWQGRRGLLLWEGAFLDARGSDR
jgi:hypothetical protein